MADPPGMHCHPMDRPATLDDWARQLAAIDWLTGHTSALWCCMSEDQRDHYRALARPIHHAGGNT